MGNKVYKICNKCGKEIDENSAFCNFCGAKQTIKTNLTNDEQIAIIEESLSITKSRFSDKGRILCESWLNEFGLDLILESVSIAITQYLRFDSNGEPEQNSVTMVFNKIGGICRNKKMALEKPYEAFTKKLMNYANKKWYIYYRDSVELEANITKLLYHYHKIGDFDSKSEDLFVLLKSTPDRYDFIDKVSHLVQELNL